MEPDPRTLARLRPGCICKGVRLIRLVEAIEQGASTVEEVQRRCNIGDGSCNGKRCGQKIKALLEEMDH